MSPNIENIKRLKAFIPEIPEKLFDMCGLRAKNNRMEVLCYSTGCMLGWSPNLMTENEQDKFIVINPATGHVVFWKIAKDFYGIESVWIWNFIFSGIWAKSPKTNTKAHAIKRIDHFLELHEKVIEIDEKYFRNYLKQEQQ